MADMNILRKAESDAERIIENAKKEAQQIFMTTPDIIEQLVEETKIRHAKQVSLSEAEIQEQVDRYAEQLFERTSGRKSELRKYTEEIEKKAEALLKNTITSGMDD